MRSTWLAFTLIVFVAGLGPIIAAQQPAAPREAPDPVATLVARLDLARYKATIKGLTRFGDRREGTDRNRAKLAAEARSLAWMLERTNETYATDYPATIGSHMTNTDSNSFMDLVPSISVRENERGMHIGSGWDPQWHQPTDVLTTYTDKDFRLGLNAAQTTLSAVAQMAGARILP